jgi:hypothetical protein
MLHATVADQRAPLPGAAQPRRCRFAPVACSISAGGPLSAPHCNAPGQETWQSPLAGSRLCVCPLQRPAQAPTDDAAHSTDHQLGCCARQARIGDGAAARRLAAELVAGINHVQYNQGNDINALAGMVRRAGASRAPPCLLWCWRAGKHSRCTTLHTDVSANANGWQAGWLCMLEAPRSAVSSGSCNMRPHTTLRLTMRIPLASCPCARFDVSGTPPLQVSLLPTIDGRLFRLARGNAQLPRALLAGCGANETRARVAEVARERDGSYTLILAPPEGSSDEQVCRVRPAPALQRSDKLGFVGVRCG